MFRLCNESMSMGTYEVNDDEKGAKEDGGACDVVDECRTTADSIMIWR